MENGHGASESVSRSRRGEVHGPIVLRSHEFQGRLCQTGSREGRWAGQREVDEEGERYFLSSCPFVYRAILSIHKTSYRLLIFDIKKNFFFYWHQSEFIILSSPDYFSDITLIIIFTVLFVFFKILIVSERHRYVFAFWNSLSLFEFSKNDITIDRVQFSFHLSRRAYAQEYIRDK